MAKLPAIQLYTGDWLKDPNLRRCSKAAKGVWIDMLCLMSECEDRGVLASGGVPWDQNEIAGAIGGDQAENLACIAELLAKGVASLTKLGAITNRRMVRDEKVRADTKFRQQKFRNSNQTNKNSNANITHDVTQMSQQSSSPTSTAIQEQILSRKKRAPERFILPDWIPEMIWNEYLAMRQRKGKSPTPFALELITKKLHGFQLQGHDPATVLEQSIRNGWTDVYAVRDRGNYGTGGGNSANKSQQRTDANKVAAGRALEVLLGYAPGTGGDAPEHPERRDPERVRTGPSGL